MQTRTPRHSERVWGDAGRVALARSYLLGWFAFSCYLQLHGLSVLFSVFVSYLFMWAAYVGEPVAPPRGPARPRGAPPAGARPRGGARAGRGRRAPQRAARCMNGDGDTYI